MRRTTISYRGKPLRSETNYTLLKLCYLLYTLAWCAIVAWVFLIWEANLGWKVPVIIILLIGTPSLSDLFTSYSSYKEIWTASNADREGDERNDKQPSERDKQRNRQP